ncbi:MAG: YgiQ family radical SAM protein [Oscillospiraceae bacterium]|nr:YgiQ family radical SAM protein [Oscillospiraceae bacterium]MCL2278661.1 YgiQ family radical SAM protein [Oscillospiraceae bacterium]
MTVYDFLPTSREDMLSRDMYYYDFLLITGDAYVDHPSFGMSVIGRVLESSGFRVAILSQPSYDSPAQILEMRRPRYAALISAGNLDSMVAHYTVSKKKRSDDYYSPGKKAGKRPDRAVIVYSKLVREAFPDLPIIIGGLEASLRRFAHYDYWDDKVRRSILVDSTADLLVYGMGEAAIVAIAKRLAAGESISDITDVRGTGFAKQGDGGSEERGTVPLSWLAGTKGLSPFPAPPSPCFTHSYESVSTDKRAYAEAAMLQHEEHDSVRGRAIMQRTDDKIVVINPPGEVMTTEELDRIYALPFTREVHPMYDDAGGVSAIDEVRFSVIHNRGCFGDCNYCALAFHQGKVVASRSHESVVKEVESFITHPLFKGYVHDVGGPTANFRRPACSRQKKHGLCRDKSCLAEPCDNLDADHNDYLQLLRKVAAISGVKKVFVRSGIRFDFLMLDKSGEFFTELVKNHISGQLKVAPEHCSDNVLYYMGKPKNAAYEQFTEKYARLNKRYEKNQFLVPYLISSHPGSTIHEAINMAEYLHIRGRQPEQVQDFYPTPGTLSTCMYYTGLDPRTMKSVHVPRSKAEKTAQRALLQWKNPKNRHIILKALKDAGREDLIGYGKRCLVRPRGQFASK